MLQRIDGGALDDVQHRVSEYVCAEKAGFGHVHHHRTTQAVADEQQSREFGPGELRGGEVDHIDHVLTKGGEAEVGRGGGTRRVPDRGTVFASVEGEDAGFGEHSF